MRTVRSWSQWVCLAALTAGLAGCGELARETEPTTLSQADADDVATQVSAQLGGIATDFEAASSVVIAGPAPSAPGRFSADAFDTTFTRGGLTFQVTRTFYGANGAALPGYTPLAVRLVWTSRAWGSIQTARDTATIGHDATLEVTGIQAGRDTLEFDGSSRDTLTNRFRSYDGTRMRYFHSVSSLVLRDVRMLKDREANPWPLSGTLTFTIEGDRMRDADSGELDAHLAATVTITFNGTPLPAVTVDGHYTYHYNLATGQLVRF